MSTKENEKKGPNNKDSQPVALRVQEAKKMHANEIIMLRTDVEKAKMMFEYAKKKRDRYQTLALKKVLPEVELCQSALKSFHLSAPKSFHMA